MRGCLVASIITVAVAIWIFFLLSIVSSEVRIGGIAAMGVFFVVSVFYMLSQFVKTGQADQPTKPVPSETAQPE